ncbi:MAG: response regulator [Candidatus Omnitrophica bacterium]|nr:response regulator [Candidatus Omnitrophota bacterium]
MAVILERMGFHVEVMTESPAALRRLAQESFDLVVCNIRMPEIDGRQLYRDLKKVRPRSFPKMIFTTGDAVDPDARLFVENNKLCLISKPFMSENLIQTILEEFTVRT